MTTQTKTQAINASDLKIAECIGKNWLKAKLKKEEADKLMKEAAIALEGIAKKNRAAFGDKGTLTIGDVKLKFTNEGYVVTGDDYNRLEFLEEYPELCKIEIKPSALKGFLISEAQREEIAGWDVAYETKEKFSVEKA